jgi:hypothetical protein
LKSHNTSFINISQIWFREITAVDYSPNLTDWWGKYAFGSSSKLAKL